LDLFPVDDDWWRIRHEIRLPMTPWRRRSSMFLLIFSLIGLEMLVSTLLAEYASKSNSWFAVSMGGILFAWGVLLPVFILVIGFVSRRRFRAILRERLLQHGVPMCLSCGYCLRGMPADERRCPECGWPIEERMRALMQEAESKP
jgi:hypothetical protein